MSKSVKPPDAIQSVLASGHSQLGNKKWLSANSEVTTFVAGQCLVFEYSEPAAAAQAAERYEWLGQYVPTVSIQAVKENWLVTSRPAGQSAVEVEQHHEPGLLSSHLGRALRQLHQIDIGQCPFSQTWEQTSSRITTRVAAGQVDTKELDDPYNRYSADELVQFFENGRISECDAVVGHGAADIADFYFDGEELTAIIGVDLLGVNDRNLDLAWMHRSMRNHYGDEAVMAFYDIYGPDESLVALDHYYLANVLLT